MTDADSRDDAHEELFAVVYLSRVRRPMTVAEVDRLVIEANAHNAMQGVTGALLYDGQQFFQYFEGPAAGVGRIYERIKHSSKHAIVSEVFNGPVPRRYFSQWHMASKKAGSETLLELGTARWLQVKSGMQARFAESEGVRRLVAFWGEGGPVLPLTPVAPA